MSAQSCPSPGNRSVRIRRVIARPYYVLRLVCEEWEAWVEAAVIHMPGRIGRLARRRFFRRRLRGLGQDCRLGEGICVSHMHNLTLGDRVGIKHVHINAKAGVTIGNDCLIAAGVKIWSANHRFADPNIPIYAQDYDEAPVTIGDDVWVAANAIVLPGVEIGHGAVVGAGAVVTRNVAAFTVVAGVPAKAIGRRGPTGLAAMD